MKKRHTYPCMAYARSLTAWVVIVSVWLSPLELYARRPLPTRPTPMAHPQQPRAHSRPVVSQAMVDAVVQARPVTILQTSREVTFRLHARFPRGSNVHEQLYGLLTAMGEAMEEAAIRFDDPESLNIPWRFQISLPPTLVGQPSRDLFDLLGMTAYAQGGALSRNIEIRVDPRKQDVDRLMSGFGQYFSDAYGSDAKTITLSILKGLGISLVGAGTSQFIQDLGRALTTQFQKKAFAYWQAAVLTVMLGNMVLDWVDYARTEQWEKLGASVAVFVEGSFYYLLGDLSRRALINAVNRPITVKEPVKAQDPPKPSREPVNAPNVTTKLAEQFIRNDTGGGMSPGPRPPSSSGGSGRSVTPPPPSGGGTAVATAPPQTGANPLAALKEVRAAQGVTVPQSAGASNSTSAQSSGAVKAAVEIPGTRAAPIPQSSLSVTTPTAISASLAGLQTQENSYLASTYALNFSAWEWSSQTLDSARIVSIAGKPLQVRTLKAGALEEYQAYARWQSALDAKWPVQIPVTELWAIAYKDIPGKYGVVAVQEVKGQTPGELQQDAQTLDRQVSDEHWALIRTVDERNGRTLRRDLVATRPIDVRFGGYDARTGTYRTLYLYNNSDATLTWQKESSARNKTDPLSPSEQSTVQTRYKPDTLISQDVSITIHGVTDNNKAAVQSCLNEARPSQASEEARHYFSDLTPKELQKAKEQLRQANKANEEELRRRNAQSGNSSTLLTVLRFLETGVLEHNTLAALEAVNEMCLDYNFVSANKDLCAAVKRIIDHLESLSLYNADEEALMDSLSQIGHLFSKAQFIVTYELLRKHLNGFGTQPNLDALSAFFERCLNALLSSNATLGDNDPSTLAIAAITAQLVRYYPQHLNLWQTALLSRCRSPIRPLTTDSLPSVIEFRVEMIQNVLERNPENVLKVLAWSYISLFAASSTHGTSMLLGRIASDGAMIPTNLLEQNKMAQALRHIWSGREFFEILATSKQVSTWDQMTLQRVVPFMKTGIELETKLSDAMLNEITTLDGTLEPLLLVRGSSDPERLSGQASRISPPQFVIDKAQGRPVGQISWDDFSLEEKRSLIKWAYEHQDFDQGRKIFGLMLREGIAPSLLPYLEHGSPHGYGELLEFHSTPSGHAGTGLSRARGEVKDLHGVQTPNIHAHITIPALLSESMTLSMLDLYVRADTLLTLIAASAKRIKSIKKGERIFFDFLTSQKLEEIYYASIHGTQTPNKKIYLKTSAVGYREDINYEGSGDDLDKLHGFEVRLLLDQPGFGEAFLSQLQEKIASGNFGVDVAPILLQYANRAPGRDGDFTIDYNSLGTQYAKTHYNQPIDDLLAHAHPDIKPLLGLIRGRTQTLEGYLRQYAESDYSLKMLIFDWRSTPLVASTRGLGEKIHAAQIQALKDLLDNPHVDRPAIKKFIANSGLLDAYAKSLGLEPNDAQAVIQKLK